MNPVAEGNLVIFCAFLRQKLRGLGFGFAALGVLAANLSFGAADASRKSFDITAGDAIGTLKQFIAQADTRLLYSVDAVKGVKTNPVKGDYTPREALQYLLAGTGLEVTQNANSGPLAIVRNDSNVTDGAQASANNRSFKKIETRQPKQTMKQKNLITLLGGLFALLVAPMDAQTAAGGGNATQEEVVKLSPFVVSTARDYGYQATSSLSGGRLSTDLDKTPSAVSVLTREFLDDIGALTVQEALEWATNAVAANDVDVGVFGTRTAGVPTLATDDGNVVRTRGIRNSSTARNYFFWRVASHAYNVERVDISRGPNALVFGDASTGGIVNITTKRARQDPFTKFSLQALSTGGAQVTADINRPVSDSLSVRVNALKQSTEGFQDFMRDDRDGISLATTWQPTKRTQVRIEGEWGDIYRRMPLSFWLERTTSWDGVTTLSAPLPGTTRPAGTTGLDRLDTGSISNRPYMVLDAGNSSAGLVDWHGFARTNGSQDLIVPAGYTDSLASFGVIEPGQQLVSVDRPASLGGPRTYPILPSFEWNVNLPGRRLDVDYHTASAYIEQRVGESLFIELAANYQYQKHILHQMQNANRIFYDVNEVMPSGEPNPNFLKPFVQGDGFRMMRTIQDIWETRLSAVYLLDTRLTRQRIGLNVSNRQHFFFRDFPRLARINGPSPNLSLPENLVRNRAYLDQRSTSLDYMKIDRTYTFGSDVVRFANYSGGGGSGAAGSGGYSGSNSQLWSGQVFATGDWLNSRRINTIFGVRRDKLENDSLGGGNIDPVTRERSGRDVTASFEDYFTSATAGAVVRVLPWLSVFANYSESFEGQSPAFDVFGNLVDPPQGKGKDYGLKLNLLDGRITGSVGYYDTIEENNRTNLTVIGTPINGIWEALGMPESKIITGSTDTQRASATGYEVDLTANITRNWSLLFNYGRPTSELENAAPAYRKYIAANRPVWEAAIADPATPADVAEFVRSRLATIDNNLLSLEDGRPVAGVAEWTANFFTRYRFLNGPLKNLTVGGGIKMVGPSFIGARSTVDASIIAVDNAPSYKNATLLLVYDAKLWGADWKFQLNVYNVLDDEALRYAAYDAAGSPLQFRTQPPRSFRFSTSVSF